MRFISVTLFALAACGAVSACSNNSDNKVTVSHNERHLTVTGAREGVERFVALQGSLRPRLPTSSIENVGDGQATARVMLPVTHSGADLVHTTREALAAGLSYEYEDKRETTSTWESEPT